MREKEEREEGRERRRKREEGRERGERMRDNIFDTTKKIGYRGISFGRLASKTPFYHHINMVASNYMVFSVKYILVPLKIHCSIKRMLVAPKTMFLASHEYWLSLNPYF